jgi:SpoVK/Ycf46/Vps4 family AAA+-type ATPase
MANPSSKKKSKHKSAAPSKAPVRRRARAQRVLLSGASSAQLQARALAWAAQRGQHLLRVDLSAVASKYIGETEKNLARLLERAEELDVVLLFDEADALFGKRSDVKDSHDRYANQETAYLLQRLADHPGSVIVTARRPARLDGASLACAGFRAARSAKR